MNKNKIRAGRAGGLYTASRNTSMQLRTAFMRARWRWAYPNSQAVPRFDTWEDAFETAAQLIADQPVILIAAAERVAVYAVTGGVPAYLEHFDTTKSVGENIRNLFIRRSGIFRSEPFVLIGDVIRRETQTLETLDADLRQALLD